MNNCKDCKLFKDNYPNERFGYCTRYFEPTLKLDTCFGFDKNTILKKIHINIKKANKHKIDFTNQINPFI